MLKCAGFADYLQEANTVMATSLIGQTRAERHSAVVSDSYRFSNRDPQRFVVAVLQVHQ